MTRIAVIGAGLSGRLLALNLVRRASPTVIISLIDRGDDRYMGPAYSDESDYLLLNVPAGRMGAYSEDPEHFLKWVGARGIRAGRLDFLPRKLYRDYIFDLTREEQQARPSGPSVEHVRGEALGIETDRGSVAIRVGMNTLIADKAVLALGNFLPRDPDIVNKAALESKRYVRNPWERGVLDPLERNETVVLIGTGQTMVDLVLALDRRGHKGRIVAISRHGLLPFAHRGFESYESFFEEIKDAKRIIDILRTVRKHLDRAEVMGIDRRAVIDSLRPHTQILWQGFPADEKRRFLRHVFRFWEIIRSRIPVESEQVIHALRASGRLSLVAGQIRDLVESEAGLEVRYAPRGGKVDEIEKVSLVINCVGPESDFRRVDQPLIRNLLERGLIRSGPANLGMDALPNGALIGRDGVPSNLLYTLGSTMKGVLWEVLAVPEIRVQAERLAQTLLEDTHGQRAGPGANPGQSERDSIRRL